jgi:hypothetical protein
MARQEAGTFVTLDGNRAVIAGQVEGVLAALCETLIRLSFLIPSRSIPIKAKNITFEGTFSGFGNYWVREP